MFLKRKKNEVDWFSCDSFNYCLVVHGSAVKGCEHCFADFLFNVVSIDYRDKLFKYKNKRNLMYVSALSGLTREVLIHYYSFHNIIVSGYRIVKIR